MAKNRIHGNGNGKYLRKTRVKINARRNAHGKMSAEDQRSMKAPGSMKYKQ